MDLETLLTFDDILLLPQYSDIKSRSEVTLSSEISEGIELRVPIIARPNGYCVWHKNVTEDVRVRRIRYYS